MTSRLRAEQIDVSYASTSVISRLDLAIPDNEVTVIVGPNACGKSTLLRTFARLIRPDSGSVFLDDREILRTPTKEVATRLALLPQRPSAPKGIRVGSLIARGRTPHQSMFQQWSEHDERAARKAMTATGTLELAEHVVDELSGGQQQRVWLAMVLAQETDVMLLDEPTTYLDIAHQIEVLDLIDELHAEQATTVVMVLHDLNLACRYATTIMAMKGGEVVAQGPPAEIITVDLIRDVFGLDCVIIPDPVSGTPLVAPVGRRRSGR